MFENTHMQSYQCIKKEYKLHNYSDLWSGVVDCILLSPVACSICGYHV